MTIWDKELERLRQKLTVTRLVTGTVAGGVVVPDAALPEGARVTVSLDEDGGFGDRRRWEVELPGG